MPSVDLGLGRRASASGPAGREEPGLGRPLEPGDRGGVRRGVNPTHTQGRLTPARPARPDPGVPESQSDAPACPPTRPFPTQCAGPLLEVPASFNVLPPRFTEPSPAAEPGCGSSTPCSGGETHCAT